MTAIQLNDAPRVIVKFNVQTIFGQFNSLSLNQGVRDISGVELLMQENVK